MEGIEMISFLKYIKETAEAGLAAKSAKSGIPIGILRKVYRRGVAAWNSGHRPGTTPQQWGMARVNSYITKGKGTYYGADKDLREEVELDEATLKSTHYATIHSSSRKIVAKGNKKEMLKKMKELNNKEKGSHHLGVTHRGKVGDTFGAPKSESVTEKISRVVSEQKELDENRQKEMSLWKYNPVSGLWKSERTVTPETKDKWLEIFKKDDPKAKFIVSKNKPGTKAHLKEEDEKRLSKVPKDKESGLPKKYVTGLSSTTAKARAAHWKKMNKKSDSDPAAYKPAPGDATAKTKPSKHTLKYREMFGEVIRNGVKQIAKTTVQAEQVEIQESNVMDQLYKIVQGKQAQTVKFANGQTRKVDHYTASAITQVHNAANDENKKKLADMVHKSPEHLQKVSDFAFKRAVKHR